MGVSKVVPVDRDGAHESHEPVKTSRSKWWCVRRTSLLCLLKCHVA